MTSSEVFKSWRPYDDFHAFWNVTPLPAARQPLVLEDYQLAICSVDFTRGYRVVFKQAFEVHLGASGVWGQPDEEQIRAMEKLGPGEYHAAYLVDGVRRSNVCTFSIDPKRAELSGPSVRMVALPALDRDVIEGVGLWVIPPNEGDPNLTNMTLSVPVLEVDGVVRMPQFLQWSGPVGPLRPRTSTATISMFINYTPEIASSDAHTVKAWAESHESKLVDLKVDRRVEREFDRYFREH